MAAGLDVFVGWDGIPELVSTSAHIDEATVVYDSRRLRAAGLEPRKVPKLVDLWAITGGGKSLLRLAREHLDPEDYRELLALEERMQAHHKALKAARVSVQGRPTSHLIPSNLLNEFLTARAKATVAVYESLVQTSPESIKHWWNGLADLTFALQEIELAGIHLDRDRALELLLDKSHPQHVQSFLRNVLELTRDGQEMARTRFNPFGTRTGRIKVDGSRGRIFNPMGIPHGVCREVVTSRFEGGHIVSVDLNAVDYRCIVASVDDQEFKDRYLGERDFHSVNCRLLGEDDRTLVKNVTYASIYGASLDTLQKLTKQPEVRLMRMLARLEELMRPVERLRTGLFQKAMRELHVDLPDGRRVPVQADDHPGKVLGLYAQGYSSLRFELSLVEIMKCFKDLKSKVIFTVHDEVVLDVHPDEPQAVEIVVRELEREKFGWPLVAKAKRGRSYRDATED